MTPDAVDKQLGARHDARQDLLEAASKLFVGKGYEAVSTREIAEAAGVNLGAIQYHFGSKAGLYIEAVKSVVEKSISPNVREVLERGATNKKEAAVRVCEFIHAYLESLLRPQKMDACRLMFREVFSDSGEEPERIEVLVRSVVTDFIKPIATLLEELMTVLVPERSLRERVLLAQSMAGQCVFYATHRQFLEKLRDCDFSQSPLFDEVVHHVAEFSLRGFGCAEEFIKETLREVFPQYQTMRSVIV